MTAPTKPIDRSFLDHFADMNDDDRMKLELVVAEIRSWGYGDRLRGWIVRTFDRARSRGMRYKQTADLVLAIRPDLDLGWVDEVLRVADEGGFGQIRTITKDR